MTNDMLDKIDDYLLGNMSPEDRDTFEKEMAADEELAAAVAVQKMQHRAWQLAERDTLRLEMAEWKKEKKTDLKISVNVDDEGQKGAKIVPLSRKIYQWAAAAAILLLVAVGVNRLFFSGLSDSEIFNKYYEEPSFVTKGATGTSPLEEAERLIENQNYNEAIRILETINDAALNDQKLLLLSHCYFKKADYSNAINALSIIINSSNDVLSIQQAEWRTVLIRLTSGQKNAPFKALLDKIANDSNHSYQAKAIEMKSNIKY